MKDLDLELEKNYWGLCTNTFYEDTKHYVYGQLMGLERKYQWFMNVQGKNILDIGGGPASMLLKTWGFARGRIYDPIKWPEWVSDRYKTINVDLIEASGEVLNEQGWDEVWIYNCLQHVVDPEKIMFNAKRAAPVIRIFEWINVPPSPGHPHMLTQAKLEQWIGKPGKVCVPDIEDNGIEECFHGVYTF